MRRLVPGLWLLGACGHPDAIPVGEYASRFADALCDRTRECARGDFDAAFYDLADCRATYEAELGNLVQAQSDAECEYDDQQAATVYASLLDMDCGDFYEGKYLEDADKIWNCDDNPFTDTLYQ